VVGGMAGGTARHHSAHVATCRRQDALSMRQLDAEPVAAAAPCRCTANSSRALYAVLSDFIGARTMMALGFVGLQTVARVRMIGTLSHHPHWRRDVHHRNKSTRHTPTAQDVGLRNAISRNEHLDREIDAYREKHGLPAYGKSHLRTHSSRSDLQDEVRRAVMQALNARDDDRDHSSSRPVANRHDPAFKAMSEYEAPTNASPQQRAMIANMNASASENERRRQRSLDYCARNPIVRQAYVTNSHDEAVRAMSEHDGGAVAYFQRGK
jgi:hypothetical protein